MTEVHHEVLDPEALQAGQVLQQGLGLGVGLGKGPLHGERCLDLVGVPARLLRRGSHDVALA